MDSTTDLLQIVPQRTVAMVEAGRKILGVARTPCESRQTSWRSWRRSLRTRLLRYARGMSPQSARQGFFRYLPGPLKQTQNSTRP